MCRVADFDWLENICNQIRSNENSIYDLDA